MASSPLQIVLLPKYNAVTGKQLPDPEEGLHISSPTSCDCPLPTECEQKHCGSLPRPKTWSSRSALYTRPALCWASILRLWGRDSSRCRATVCMLSRFAPVRLFAMLCTVVHQALLSMRLSRHVCWVGGHFLLQRIFPTPGSNPHLLQLLP